MNEPLYPREGNSGWTHRLVRPPPPEPYPPLPLPPPINTPRDIQLEQLAEWA